MDDTTFFNKTSFLWDQLDSFVKKPTCVCGTSTCNLTKKIREKEEQDKIIVFLLSLNENFTNIKTQILAIKKISPLIPLMKL